MGSTKGLATSVTRSVERVARGLGGDSVEGWLVSFWRESSGVSDTIRGELGINGSSCGSVSSCSPVSTIITSSSGLSTLPHPASATSNDSVSRLRSIGGFLTCFGMTQTVSALPSRFFEVLGGGLLNMTGVCVFRKVSNVDRNRSFG